MKIQFCGATRNVTGSQILITANDTTVLLDCGLFQGRRQETYEKNRHFIFDPASVNSLVLSHCHIDHSGNIPNLVRRGFKGSIFATPPTTSLCKIMLKDSAYLQQKDIEWVNKIRTRKNEPLFQPLYTMEDVEASLNFFVEVEYNKTFTIGPGINAQFLDSGHTLGSASIVLDIEEDGKLFRLGYTGDIGRPHMPIIRDPVQIQDADILIMESTYGNRVHGPYTNVEESLAQLINQTSQAGGNILIPAFAVGRTQLIVYILHKLFNENRIPEIPIFVDSPMAVHSTEIFRSFLNILDRETKRIFLDNNEDPFEFRRLTYVETVEESKKLNDLKFPHVIISASGMMEGGRILHHLRNNVGNHRNLILFVGYAARNTLARKIIDGEKNIKIFGEEFVVKCQTACIDAFSAHADRHELLDYLELNNTKKLKQLFLIHGELEQSEPLRNALRSKGYTNVSIPDFGEIFNTKKDLV